MKSRFFPKRDEVVLSTITLILVGGLVYHGCVSLANGGKEHALFQKNPVVVTNK